LCVESKVVLIVITGGVSVVPPVAAVYNWSPAAVDCPPEISHGPATERG
jgi:hypothetical protein